MHDDRWFSWAGLIVAFVLFQIVRALLRGVKAKSGESMGGGMARLNAAAERILKERGISAANPIPRTKPMGSKPAGVKSSGSKSKRVYTAGGKPRTQAPMPKSSTPAVIRRGGILSSAREPVIQRRR